MPLRALLRGNGPMVAQARLLQEVIFSLGGPVTITG